MHFVEIQGPWIKPWSRFTQSLTIMDLDICYSVRYLCNVMPKFGNEPKLKKKYFRLSPI